jgi:hypothetical protein
MSEIDERPVVIAYDGSEHARAQGVLHHAHRPVLVVSGE